MPKQINIQVSDEKYEELRTAAFHKRVSVSCVVREALNTPQSPKQDPSYSEQVPVIMKEDTQETRDLVKRLQENIKELERKAQETPKQHPSSIVTQNNLVFSWSTVLPWLKDEIETAERINKPSRPGLYDRLLSSLQEFDLVKKSRIKPDVEE